MFATGLDFKVTITYTPITVPDAPRDEPGASRKRSGQLQLLSWRQQRWSGRYRLQGVLSAVPESRRPRACRSALPPRRLDPRPSAGLSRRLRTTPATALRSRRPMPSVTATRRTRSAADAGRGQRHGGPHQPATTLSNGRSRHREDRGRDQSACQSKDTPGRSQDSRSRPPPRGFSSASSRGARRRACRTSTSKGSTQRSQAPTIIWRPTPSTGRTRSTRTGCRASRPCSTGPASRWDVLLPLLPLCKTTVPPGGGLKCASIYYATYQINGPPMIIGSSLIFGDSKQTTSRLGA